MNKAKKIAGAIIFILSALTYTRFASAVAYTPLVRIPGLPAAGTVNLSMYMVGLYNFLLSIVGIVAVMMLIFGGMRYITAMGSSSAISSAKDIVTNAFFGLLLALISWVIVSTINPDILFIQSPTSRLPASSFTGVRDVACTKSNDPCECNDNTPLPGSTFESCSNDCRLGNHCAFTPAVSTTCIGIGTSNQGVADTSGVYQCNCVDGEVVAKGAAATCNAACLPANCGWDFLRIKWDPIDVVGNLDSRELWEFFLTNDGTYDEFNVTVTSTNFGGPNTYDCAILITEEENLANDFDNIIWVQQGITIHKNSYNLERDLQPGIGPGVICAGGPPFCSLCGGNIPPQCGMDSSGNISPGISTMWHMEYGVLIKNHCDDNNCRLAKKEEQFEYRPAPDITCSSDGKWHLSY